MSRETVAVRIAGHEYKIRTETDATLIRELAGYVDRAMARVRERTGTVDTLDVSVLTSLNLAREILTLRDERTPEDASVVEDSKLRALIERVESAARVANVAAEESISGAEAVEGRDGEADGAADGAGAPRTLELPSIDSLRDRSAGASSRARGGQGPSGNDEDADDEMAAPRVAAGGRDRAS